MHRSAARPGKHRLIADAETRSFSRERLYARLDVARRSPVTLVIADQGLGKSTLLRDYLALRAAAHVRFTAGPQHATLGELLRGFAAAFSTANPALARSFQPALLGLEQPDGEAAALNWLREHLGGLHATVVLDELHHVVADARCASFLTAMIDATLPNVRWILLLRDASTLPVPRWLSSGIADLPIESAELRVQPDEIRFGVRPRRHRARRGRGAGAVRAHRRLGARPERRARDRAARRAAGPRRGLRQFGRCRVSAAAARRRRPHLRARRDRPLRRARSSRRWNARPASPTCCANAGSSTRATTRTTRSTSRAGSGSCTGSTVWRRHAAARSSTARRPRSSAQAGGAKRSRCACARTTKSRSRARSTRAAFARSTKATSRRSRARWPRSPTRR